MPAKQSTKVLALLSEKLTEREFLNQTGQRAKKMRTLVTSSLSPAKLNALWPVTRRITCGEVLALSQKLLRALSPEPKEGWLKFTYDFACHILYPDDAFTKYAAPYKAGAFCFLAILQFFLDEERKVIEPEATVDFEFLTDSEASEFESHDEYMRFKKVWRREYVYEMMRLNKEATTFNTLAHLAGVHFVAMHIARGLYDADVPVDMALVSAAAAAHDIGKFGCKPGERVPYLHYYYTDRWFTRNRMDYIGHIAANHSTWDLEPDNISLESLVLIYCDFRVKEGGDGSSPITALEDAFNVIRGKLDNLDAKKLRRYKTVYAKLCDFEEYLKRLGIDIDLNGKTVMPPPMPSVTLRNVEESVLSLTLLGVEHNIAVMRSMTAERQFGNFLEAARSEKNWKNLYAYLNIYDRYIAYTNDLQKKQTLLFLYELLMHRESNIRAEASRLIGKILVQFNFGYRKQLPEGIANTAEETVTSLWKSFLTKIITPDHRLTDVQQRRIRFQLKNVVAAMMRYAAEDDKPVFLSVLMTWFDTKKKRKPEEAFSLLDAVEYIPLDTLPEQDLQRIAQFALSLIDHPEDYVRIAAWRAGRTLVKANPAFSGSKRFADYAKKADTSGHITEAFLKYRILSYAGLDAGTERERLYDPDIISDIFLENLKTATPWITTAVNIKLLADHLKNGPATHRLHIAAHLSNLIKVSEYVDVRDNAGQALLAIMPLLYPDERNEVVFELMRGLEMGEQEFSKYIPRYLGESALWLPPKELEEILRYIRGLLANPNDRVVSYALDTIGVMLRHHPEYRDRFKIDRQTYAEAREYFFGILLRGLASYRTAVRQEALQVIAHVFGADTLPLNEKYELFALGYNKLLYFIGDNREGRIPLFYRAGALSSITRFITAWKLETEDGNENASGFRIRERKKVAFFPGSFDPFTLSHKGIAKEVRNMGYEVYLAIDEFSWSKKTQPHLIRRRIIDMSVADEFHINVFPVDTPVNIANPENLKTLRELFKGKEVSIVAGSDVIAGASAYRGKPERHSIHNFNHLVFRRQGEERLDSRATPQILNSIRAKVTEFELPEHLLDISSMMIRSNIDLNRDISNLIDPSVQEYIYHNGLYLREPEYKPIASGQVAAFENAEHATDALLDEIGSGILRDVQEKNRILNGIRTSGDRLRLLRNTLSGNKLIGVLRERVLEPNDLFSVLGSVQLADDVRQRTSGSILLISGIYTAKDSMVFDPEQYLVSESIARALAAGCSFALYFPEDGYYTNNAVSAITRQGFKRAEDARATVPVYLVDMHAPLLLLQNLGTSIKEPFASGERVLRVLDKTHRSLQQAMTGLYPGQLVLSVSAATIFPRLMEKITEINGVPNKPLTPRVLGPCMCVPYGKILRDKVIYNTVTKTLHTDKVFPPDLNHYAIEAFQYYPSLENQIRMIKSFRRPVILIDDILHRGGRFEVLEPLLKQQNITIKKVVLGILSGFGKDTMRLKGVDVDSIYFLPNLRSFIMESSLYPFIGGDTVRRNTVKVAGLSPSINMILPYTRPNLEGISEQALFDYSATCIENARDVFLVLEEEYRTQFGRNLTLERLSEAVLFPLCPDRGECIGYDPSLAASVYLENDLQMLYRT